MVAVHPTDDNLIAYGLGKLADAAAADVLAHLVGCEACKRRVAGLSADSFVGKLREGRAAAPPVSGDTGRSAPAPAVPRFDESGVPPELLTLKQYTGLRELGRGGMGVVYVAENTDMARREALKVVQRSRLEKAGAGAVERFLREIQAAARLQHPNVVTAYAVHRPGDLLVFAMEYAPGHDLAEVVKAKGPLAVPVACSYIHAASLGLQHAHESGMVHRDIKPGNLILTKVNGKPAVKVLDFGLAKVTTGDRASTDLTGDGKMMGTPDYMAPEQALDAARADVRADVYSLGCTLYYLLAGKSPFGGGTLLQVIDKHRFTEATALNLVQPTVPVELAAAVAKMMAKDPAKRYRTPAEVAKAVRPFLGQPRVKPVTVPPRPATAETSRPALTAPVQPAPTLDPAPVVSVSPRPATAVPVRRKPGRFWPTAAAAGLLAVLVAGAALVFRTPDGTIHLDGVPADAEVVLDGSTATVTRNGETVTLTARRGPHRLKVVQGGVELLVKDEGAVTVGGEPLTVRVEPPTPPAGPLSVGSPRPAAPAAPPAGRVLHRVQTGDASRGYGPAKTRLTADGVIRTRTGQLPTNPGTWTLTDGGKTLTLRWPNAAAPGGVWVDTYTSDDGVEFGGSNNGSPPRRLVARLSGPPTDAENADDAKTEKLREALLDHSWNYVDHLYLPGGPCRFFDDGTFHEPWRWRFWVVGPTEMRVSYDRNNFDWASGVKYTFNDDLTQFTGEFTDERGRVHQVTGTRE